MEPWQRGCAGRTHSRAHSRRTRNRCPAFVAPAILALAPLALALVALGCGSSQQKRQTTVYGRGSAEPEQAPPIMSEQEARAYIDHLKRKAGILPPSSPAPASMAEVMDILKRDDFQRFPAARDYVIGKSGKDALAVRVGLQMTWGSGQLTAARIFDELTRRKALEIDQLKAVEDSAGQVQRDKRTSELKAELKDQRKAAAALRILADTHLKQGKELADELLRQAPKAPEGFRALASYYRLKRAWSEFDTAVKRAEELGEPDQLYLEYLRGMELAERWNSRAEARRKLREVLEKDGSLVRVQADLVLLQDEVEPRFSELQKLRALQPVHPVVVLAGDSIKDAYETRQALRGAS